VPNVVKDKEQLASANSLGLIAGFGTFPLGAIAFAALAGVAKWLGGFSALSFLSVEQESLAIWVNSVTFLVAAVIISRLDLPEGERRIQRIDWTQTFRDIVDGLRFIHSHPLVRGVMIGLAGGLLGGGAMVPLGPVFARDVLGAGSAGFGLLMTALGIGAALGVLTVLWLQRRLPRQTVFVASVVASGSFIVVAATLSSLTLAMLVTVAVGATAGAAYVTGFTVLQESVADDLRGRTFATLYTVVRLALLLSLTAGPFAAGGLDRVSARLVDRSVELVGFTLPLPGVRLALWAGGGLAVLAGLAALRRMRHEHREELHSEARS
jgi:dTMP kinase